MKSLDTHIYKNFLFLALILFSIFNWQQGYSYSFFPVMPSVEEYQLPDSGSLFESEPELETAPPKKHYFLALGWVLASNVSLMTFNRFVLNAEYAQVSGDTIQSNLKGPWVWDQDEFSVNHLGHPYQGSTYFVSARVNGLSFAESVLYTVIGSTTWEIFCENEAPSYNDLIATTMGGVQVGEMAHRLYVETDPLNSFLSFMVSPVDYIKYHTSKKEKRKRKYRKIEVLDLSLYTADVWTSVTFKDKDREDDNSEHPFIFGGALDVVYGKSYGLNTRKPFENFEFSANIGAGKNYFQATIFSDAFLFAVNPFSKGRFQTSLGMSTHYDVIYTDEIMYSGNAIGFTGKQRISLPHQHTLYWALHLNWLVLGSSDYYYFVSGEIDDPENGEERRNYDLGTGANTKIMAGYSNPFWGSLGFSYLFTAMQTIPGSVPDEGSSGYTIIGMWQVFYEHRLWDSIWLGISNNIYHKKGYYKDAENLSHFADYGSLYMKMKF
jgi:hypothetical protein